MRTGQDQLTNLSQRHVALLIIDDTCPRMENGTPNGACFAQRIFRCEAKAVDTHFGQSIALTKFQATRGISVDDRQRTGGTARHAETHAGEIGGCELLVLHHHLENGGDSKDNGAAFLLDCV